MAGITILKGDICKHLKILPISFFNFMTANTVNFLMRTSQLIFCFRVVELGCWLK